MGDVSTTLEPGAAAGRKQSWRWLVPAGILLVLIGIAGAFGVRSYGEFEGRAKFAEVYTEGFLMQDDAAREFSAPPGAAPAADREVTPRTRYVRRLVVSPANRSIVLWVDPRAFDDSGVAEGATLRFTLDAAGSSWTCAADGIPRRYVIVACRR